VAQFPRLVQDIGRRGRGDQQQRRDHTAESEADGPKHHDAAPWWAGLADGVSAGPRYLHRNAAPRTDRRRRQSTPCCRPGHVASLPLLAAAGPAPLPPSPAATLRDLVPQLLLVGALLGR